MGSRKGGSYERQICNDLSMWWSEGFADDWFWRTAGSGGRATQRRKKGKRTAGHSGDIAATTRDGEDLLKLLAIEVKRGYNRNTLHNLLDKPQKAAVQLWEEWIEQAETSAKNSDAPYWLIIHKRDFKEPMCYLPTSLSHGLEKHGAFPRLPVPCVGISIRLNAERIDFVGMRLKSFFKMVTPDQVRSYARTIL